jgi:hypothetical protein
MSDRTGGSQFSIQISELRIQNSNAPPIPGGAFVVDGDPAPPSGLRGINSIEPPTGKQFRMRNGELRIDNCAPSETEGAQWTGTESNRRHKDFQSFALPTELPVRIFPNLASPKGEAKFGKIQDPARRDPKTSYIADLTC